MSTTTTTEYKPSKKYIAATYRTHAYFYIPEGIDLDDSNITWYIRRDTMYITIKDDDGNYIKELEVKWAHDPIENLCVKEPDETEEGEDK